MRLVFISSVTAMTPLRTISAITGSSARRFGVFLPDVSMVFFAMILPPLPDRDGEVAEPIDLQRIAGHQHRRRRVLLDQRRARDAVAGHECGAGKRARGDESAA